TCPGTNCVYEFAIATIGLPKSESVMPVARHSERAPAALRPTVVVRDLSGGMGVLHSSGRLRRTGGLESAGCAVKRVTGRNGAVSGDRAGSDSGGRQRRPPARPSSGSASTVLACYSGL